MGDLRETINLNAAGVFGLDDDARRVAGRIGCDLELGLFPKGYWLFRAA